MDKNVFWSGCMPMILQQLFIHFDLPIDVLLKVSVKDVFRSKLYKQCAEFLLFPGLCRGWVQIVFLPSAVLSHRIAKLHTAFQDYSKYI